MAIGFHKARVRRGFLWFLHSEGWRQILGHKQTMVSVFVLVYTPLRRVIKRHKAINIACVCPKLLDCRLRNIPILLRSPRGPKKKSKAWVLKELRRVDINSDIPLPSRDEKVKSEKDRLSTTALAFEMTPDILSTEKKDCVTQIVTSWCLSIFCQCLPLLNLKQMISKSCF